MGPCVIAEVGGDAGAGILNSRFDIASTSDEAFVTINEGQSLSGIVLLHECLFRKCIFQNIKIAGTKDLIERWKKGMGQIML